MSFWDNVKKFAQPYSDDDYDDYDEEDEYLDDYDEPTPARRTPRRVSAEADAPVTESIPTGFGFGSAAPSPAPAASAPAAAATPVMPPLSTPATASTGFTGSVLNSRKAVSKQEVVLFRPTTFNDTTKAADDLRSHKALIVNMENVDKAMARRVADFLGGCVYAMGGTMRKIAQSAYLFCPEDMDVVGDLEHIQPEVDSYV